MKKIQGIMILAMLLHTTGCITANTSKKLDIVPDAVSADYGRYDDGAGKKLNLQGTTISLYWSIEER